MLQRKLHWGKSFKQRAVFNGFLHDFFNAKIHEARIRNQKYKRLTWRICSEGEGVKGSPHPILSQGEGFKANGFA